MLLLIAALLVASSFCDASTDCSGSSRTKCQHHMKTTEFPQTPEEMDTACESILEFMACSIEHEENCRKDVYILDDMNRAKSILERVCNKDLHLYRAIADNLVCIKEALHNIPCDLRDEVELEEFESKLKKQGIHPMKEDKYYPGQCTSQLFSLACRAAKVGNECGETARDAVTEIFQSVFEPADVCSEEIISEFPTVVRMLQAEKLREEVEESLEESLEE